MLAGCDAEDSLVELQVVAAELNNAGSREIVMFIIRVADDSGEWSVARRFRNFETLHRAMRGCGGHDASASRAPASVTRVDQVQGLRRLPTCDSVPVTQL